jgi:adenylate cyclase
VERMANIIDTIVEHDFITEIRAEWKLAVAVAILSLAALTGALTEILPTRLAVLAGAAPLAGWFGAAQWAFVGGLWLPLVGPVSALAAASIGVLLFRYWVVDRDGRLIRSAFRHYLAPELVAVLAAHPERLRLGGETRSMTIMFCDVRGFTSISEGFKSNPDGLTQLINRFLTPMSDIIMSHGGTIDKYMGDCIMAFWNAPLADPEHADHASATARAMMLGLEKLNRELEAEAVAKGRPFVPLDMGIGINTGDCVVGNMGSDRRFDYSVLGDAVNLASRLEGQSRTYGVGIVIGETTRVAAPGRAAIELDLIAVKGKREAVRIYALLGDHGHARLPRFLELAEPHGRMLACYRSWNWDGARAALGECRRREPRLAQLYDLYDQRIEDFAANPPGPDWNGVFVATEK